jgi:RNA polymerase sigma-70 factor (ECF subfamily)
MAIALTAEFDPDVPLVEALRNGDESAYAELWRRHQRWVKGVVFSVIGDADAVDDVAQQSWWSVWERIGTLRDSRRWRSWLYRLVRNAAIDAGRERGRDRLLRMELAVGVPPTAGSVGPDRSLERSEQHAAVLDAIRSLPAIYREPFVLRHLEDWSYREIGQTLGLPVDTVETRLVRARRLVREALAGRVVESEGE